MKCLIVLVSVGIFVSSAVARVKTGTIVVAYFTEDKIIMAADSRIVFDHQRTVKNDSECKISTPYGKMIFSSSNFMGYNAPSTTVL